MLQNEKLKKIMLYLFIGFMIAQPIFDIFWLYSDNIIAIFKFSPSTIIRMLIMGVLAITTFIWYKDKRKYKALIIGSVVYILYAIFHHLNSLQFYIPYGNFDNYSFIKEMFYLIRMIMPLLIIFITYEKQISLKYFHTIVVSVALIFSVTMVLTNFLGIALSSYGSVTHQIKATFFDWFSSSTYEKYQYLDVASKGLFHMANQVSGVLVCLLPILIYFYFKKPNILHTITLMFTILAMIMLGTRVASIGWIAICAVMILFYLFFVFIKREIELKKSALIIMIAIMIIFTAIIPFSPVMNRTYINDNSDVVEDNIKGANLNKDLTKFKKYIAKKEKENLTDKEKKELKKEKVNFIKNSYNTFGVDRTFIEKIYSYTEDPDFWLQEYEIPFNDRANHRQLKKDITRHVIELNDNPVDYIFGMSFTRLRNAQCYMENDILVHIYSIGIIGIILFIFPYFAILCYSLYKIFTNYKIQFNFLNISLLGSITLVFFAGIMSGNVFDEWICTLFLGLICGFLLININMNKSNNEENKKIKLKN